MIEYHTSLNLLLFDQSTQRVGVLPRLVFQVENHHPLGELG